MTSQNQSKSTAVKRLLNDLKAFNQDDDNETLFAAPHDNNIMIWDCVMFGPEHSLWEGGIFKMTVTFSEDYPNKPPKIIMKTPVFHPNFYANGLICLDILNTQWSPVFDAHAVLKSIQSLLTDPNPSSPANFQAAQLYRNNIQEYNKKVKECVENSQNEEE